ncbi:phenylacetate 2-hydroxylase [Trichoderma arundinaceum]|uniref:Phenylacetate 2-hydroxylase n=1 Tax=Trichoderma arundinaceum TaxID=490622 RepID=A0A395P043_TRIAR|nr:phenylacetate 2-hydroxylase [Trichoderma arundinaceum]
MAYQILGIAIIATVFVVLRVLSATDTPKVKGVPEIPGIPIFGNLLQLGVDHARVARKWASKYGPVFQARLGNRRIIFVNSYEAVKHFWITHQSSLISRPTFHTFHSVVSSSQGFTIGTSPWDESCKRRRKAAATALNRPAVQSYMPILDLESTVSIKELLNDCKDGSYDVDPSPYMARFALNTSLTLNYGFRIDGNINDELLTEITHVEREISNFRSTSNNWQDYIPLLRIFGKMNTKAEEYRLRRDKYLTDMLHDLKERIANGTDRPCITGNVLKDPEAKLNEAELKSICLTMVSAGLDTVPGNIIMGMAYLSTEDGQNIQAKALKAIEEAYPNGDSWEKCLVEEKVPYVTALVKETLRFWTVIPICLPRTNIKDIPYEGSVIPAGTTFFMNAYAADYDDARFKLPDQFIPERFLEDKEIGTPHYAYGAGSRMCAGSHLANRELYTAYIRLITSFQIVSTKDPSQAPIIHPIECNSMPTSLTTDPKPFKVGLKPRNEAKLREWIAAAEERTKDL